LGYFAGGKGAADAGWRLVSGSDVRGVITEKDAGDDHFAFYTQPGFRFADGRTGFYRFDFLDDGTLEGDKIKHAPGLTDPRGYIKTLFLKQQTTWPDGTPAPPLSRRNETAAQQAFLADVLDMNQDELENHWLRTKQTQGETPPREVGPELILYRCVTKEVGSFSVTSAAKRDSAPIEVEMLFEFGH